MIRALRRLFYTLLLILLFAPSTHASEEGAEQSDGAPIDVQGKVADHHEFAFLGAHIPLPRIMLVEGEWYFYGSTESAIESGNFVEKEGALVPASGAHVTLDLSVTSHLVYVWISLLLTLLITVWMGRRYKKGVGRETEPRGWFQNMFEVLFEFIRDDVAKTNISDDKYERFVPYLFTVFIGITFMNLFGLVPWGATATADITVTAVLAAFTFFITQWNGSKDHWEHVFWFPGVPGWMRIILTPIEIIGLFTKPFALCVRLFANMLSGKIMIICILGLIFIFADIFGNAAGVAMSFFAVPLTVGLYILKAFVCVLQAYIFTLLSAVFIGMATDEHTHEEGIEAHA